MYKRPGQRRVVRAGARDARAPGLLGLGGVPLLRVPSHDSEPTEEGWGPLAGLGPVPEHRGKDDAVALGLSACGQCRSPDCPLLTQQRPQNTLLAWDPGSPTRRSFAGCRDPRPGCTSAPSPGTWKVSLLLRLHGPARQIPCPCCRGAQAKRVGRIRAKSGWRELWRGEFQASSLDSTVERKGGILPKFCASVQPGDPPAWGPRCRDPHAARHRSRRGRGEAGRTGKKDQRKAVAEGP
ncbi:uncharacterized protein LOC114901585 [Monodon monoceros]|uniref:uncharacterized protein LOC114901585 n=1 Tax=Monodon monoceros TaxID=40151 RepID=UPI0010F47B26|nr:uncharacterized protein LOC114901585 [Monodon monoceros]